MKRLKLTKASFKRIAEETPDIKDDVIEFFTDNPNPDDDTLHEWAEDRGLDPHEVEEVVYELATEHVQEETGDDTKDDQIPGGKADDEDPDKYDQDQLEKGTEVEMEHTDDPELAEEITTDHLEESEDFKDSDKPEDKKYYNELTDMEEDMKKKSQQMDVNQLQPGQSIWDTAGKEWKVVEDDPNQPYKTLMPAETSLSGVPEGVTPQNVTNVRDEEIMSTYSLSQEEQTSGVQMAETAPTATASFRESIDYKEKIEVDEPYPPEVVERAEDWMRMDPGETNVENWKALAKRAQEINWNDLSDIATDLVQAISDKDFQRVTECTEDLTEMILMNVSMPEDVSGDELTFASKISQMLEEIIPENDENIPDEGEFPYNLPEGRPGFVACMNKIQQLRDEGFANIDIILKIGEEFDRDIGQKALDEAKYRGIL